MSLLYHCQSPKLLLQHTLLLPKYQGGRITKFWMRGIELSEFFALTNANGQFIEASVIWQKAEGRRQKAELILARVWAINRVLIALATVIVLKYQHLHISIAKGS